MTSIIKRAAVIFQRENKAVIFSKMNVIRKQYGFFGLLRAVRNKIDDRPILCGLGDDEYVELHPLLRSQNMDRVGSEILKEQQAELTLDEKAQQMYCFGKKPLISVIMPLYNPPVRWLAKAIESLQAQCYENWELCAVDDGSKDQRGFVLLESMIRKDIRIRLLQIKKNRGISAASNQALAMARGEFVALMDQDDEIPPDAFFWFVKEINEHPDVDFIYSDECKIDTNEGKHRSYSSFYLKPDWSPILLLNHMYVGHMSLYRTELVRKVGGFRGEYDFSQDYDLALRMSDATDHIRHLERVLYYWRMVPSSAASGAKAFARIANIGAVRDWYERHGMKAVMERWRFGNYGSLVLNENPKVSIIIPSDSYQQMEKCIDGLLRKTSYKNIEIIPVTNSKTTAKILEEFPYVSQIRICTYDKYYNFSDKCNEGAKMAEGEFIIFYNDDVLPLQRDWIERQIELLMYPGVGGVSPLLLHENKTVQYAGMITGTPGLIGTSFNGVLNNQPVDNPYKHALIREVSVLSGACMVIPRSIFEEIGGFDAVHTPRGHSDLDLSLKLREKGYRCVYTPYAVLTHVGNHSWEKKEEVDKADIYCLKRWGKYLGKDTYFSHSMKRMYYTDFRYSYKLHSPKNLIVPQNDSARDILFISHELSRTGAPIVLKDMVQIVLENGDFPVLLAFKDGSLKQEFLDMGVTVIIDQSARQRHWMFERFARNFDLVIANTLSCYDAIYLLNDSLPPVLWWVHEGAFATKLMRPMLPKKLGNNVKVYTVSDYSTRMLRDMNVRYQTDKLSWGIPDFITQKETVQKNEKMTFLIVGSIEKRKGQDIVLGAISLLSDEICKKTRFIFVGNVLDEQIYKALLHAMGKYDNIQYLRPIPRKEMFMLYQEADCIIVPSRDEPMSLVAVEAMLLFKLLICSDHTGIAQFMQESVNGMIFKNGNKTELAKKITYAVKNRNHVEKMGTEGRKIYEQNFTMEHYRNNVIKIIDEMVE